MDVEDVRGTLAPYHAFLREQLEHSERGRRDPSRRHGRSDAGKDGVTASGSVRPLTPGDAEACDVIVASLP